MEALPSVNELRRQVFQNATVNGMPAHVISSVKATTSLNAKSG
jgi:hypothetical protein